MSAVGAVHSSASTRAVTSLSDPVFTQAPARVTVGRLLTVRFDPTSATSCVLQTSGPRRARSQTLRYTTKGAQVQITWGVPRTAAAGRWRLALTCAEPGVTEKFHATAQVNVLAGSKAYGSRLVGRVQVKTLPARDLPVADRSPSGQVGGLGSGGGSTSPGGFPAYQCTYWADTKRPDIHQLSVANGAPADGLASSTKGDWWWNAWRWAQLASTYGHFPEGTTPTAGAVAVYSKELMGNAYGHVAYVESVNSDGTFVISQMNVDGTGTNPTPNTNKSVHWRQGITFIYGGSVPTPQPTPSPTPSPVTPVTDPGSPAQIADGDMTSLHFDVDGDGRKDLVNIVGTTVQTWIGRGNGLYDVVTQNTPTTSGLWFSTEANGDTHGDLVNIVGSTVQTWIGRGNGLYDVVTQNTPTTSGLWFSTEANGDTHGDLVNIVGSTVQTWIGRGNGLYDVVTQNTPTTSGLWFSTEANGDTHGDLVNIVGSTVQTWIGRGNGLYDVVTQNTPTTSGLWFSTEANGDTHGDLVNIVGSTVQTWIGRGNGLYDVVTQNTPTTSGLWFSTEANGDTHGDLVNIVGSTVQTWIGRGNGLYDVVTQNTPTTSGLWFSTEANGDTHGDLVNIVGSTVQTWIGRGNGLYDVVTQNTPSTTSGAWL